MTLLKSFWKGQLHRIFELFHNFVRKILVVSAEIVIDPAETISVWSMTRGNGFSRVIDHAEIQILSIFSANIRPYAKRL
jgi:hypothetical protein